MGRKKSHRIDYQSRRIAKETKTAPLPDYGSVSVTFFDGSTMSLEKFILIESSLRTLIDAAFDISPEQDNPPAQLLRALATKHTTVPTEVADLACRYSLSFNGTTFRPEAVELARLALQRETSKDRYGYRSEHFTLKPRASITDHNFAPAGARNGKTLR